MKKHNALRLLMKKIWLLKVLGICLCIFVSIFLFTKYSNGQLPFFSYGYQQSYNPNNFYVSPSPFKDPYRNNPFLEDDYEPPPDFSNLIWTDPWTAYDPSGGSMVNVNWQPEFIGTSPYFRQTGYNPWNQPYNYGWNQSYNYGWNQPYGYGYQLPYNPYKIGYQQPYYPSYGGDVVDYYDPYDNYLFSRFYPSYPNGIPYGNDMVGYP